MTRALRAGWLFTGALACAGCVSTTPPRSAFAPIPASAQFAVDGKPLCFAGSNNYYAIYKPKPVVDDLFQSAAALDFKVLRVWGMLDRGSLDGQVGNADAGGAKDGVYFQYWDSKAQKPAYNDGPDGLTHLDYVLAAAAKHGIKLIVVLLNNWREFGGVEQYLLWYGKTQHHDFWSAPETKQAYRAWLEHVLTRKNSVSGLMYKDDPAVFAWELANEPRLRGAGDPEAPGSEHENASAGAPAGAAGNALTDWAAEMSAYVKSLDPNHLVSVGDEGFLTSGGQHWAYRGPDGVDSRALTALPSVDFGTFHLYPEDWQVPAGFEQAWIADHLRLAAELGKPTLFEEYGTRVKRKGGPLGDVIAGAERRSQDYRAWNDQMRQQGGSGALSWMLAGSANAGSRYPDYDGYAFYADDATGRLLAEAAKAFERAPTCAAPLAPSSASPFVSVVKAPRRVALGWLQGEL